MKNSGKDNDPGRDNPAFAEDGTDLTLIRWMLGMSPGERLKVAQRYARALRKVANVRKSS